MRRNVITVWAVCSVLATGLQVGCKTGRAPVHDLPTVRVADGFYMEYWLLGEDNLALIYRVNGLRALGFGGGADARNRNLNWAGKLTSGQYDRLQELLEQDGWYAGNVTSTGEPRQRITRVQLRWGGKSRRYKLRGECAAAGPVRALLDDAARRRFEPELERLPKAGDRIDQ